MRHSHATKLLVPLFVMTLAAACTSAPAVTPTATIPASTPTTAPAGTPVTPAGNMPTRELTMARDACIADLAKTKSIPAQEIAFMDSQAVDWPDTSLGNPQPGNMYAQVITPGWKIYLAARGTRYEYHTNKDGSSITLVGSAPLPPGYTPTTQTK